MPLTPRQQMKREADQIIGHLDDAGSQILRLRTRYLLGVETLQEVEAFLASGAPEPETPKYPDQVTVLDALMDALASVEEAFTAFRDQI